MTTDARSPGPTERWLFGPLPDLLLGGGLIYLVLFALMTFYGSEMRAFAPITLLPLATLFTGVPHYGATLLRVCERPDDRHAYSLVAIASSVAVAAALVFGLRSETFGSWLLTVYLTWSPWHYSGQNYGISLMFLRRRGVAISVAAKRCLYASFVLSFALTVLSIHGSTPGSDYAPVSYEHSVYHLVSLGIPEAIRIPAMIAVGVSYCVALLAAAVLLLRGGGARDLAPAAVVAGSQALWFSIPVLARYAGLFQTSGPLSAEFAAYAFVWIGIAHSVQYLWITSYFALRSDRSRQSRGVPRVSRFLFGYAGKVLAAGALLWVLPALLFAPGALGNLPFDAGLAVMITAAINVHHFILDGAIWKLRDGRIARILIRDASQSESPETAFTVGGTQRLRRWAGPLIWSLGACCVAIFGFGVLELEIGARGALSREDTARAEVAADRLAWIGRDSPALRANIGLLAARSGNLERGIEQLQRSLRIFETEEGLVGLASLYSRSGRQLDATALYRRALEIEPDTPEILNNLAWILAVYDTGEPGRADEAIELARRASEQLGHQSAVALDTLAVAHAAAGRFEKAHQIGLRALALARKDGEQELADEIGERLARYRARRPFRP